MTRPRRRPDADDFALSVLAVALGAALVLFAVAVAVAACVGR